MIQELTYNIAGHLLTIETPDSERTESLLPSFAPFKESRKMIAETGILFRFAGDKSISFPTDGVLLETVSFATSKTETKIYKTESGYFIASQIENETHRMTLTEDLHTVHSDISVTQPKEKDFLLAFITIAFNLAIAPTNSIRIHASVIEKDGEALLFLGKSGTGKSTHSSLWLQHVPGCTLLNDDAPIVRYFSTGEVVVYGSPWSGKTPCYRSEQAKVKAFVHLYQSKENKLQKLSATDGLSSLLFSTTLFRSCKKNKSVVFHTLMNILEQVPVYRLDCRPDAEAVKLTHSLISEQNK